MFASVISRGRIYLARDLTDNGTPAATTETVLKTYSIPAALVNPNTPKQIRVRAWGTNAANVNVKTVRCRLGGTTGAGTIVMSQSSFTSAAFRWILEGTFGWRGAAIQDGMFWGLIDELNSAPGEQVERYQGTEPDGAAFLIEITGQNGTAALNDIVCNGFEVELIP